MRLCRLICGTTIPPYDLLVPRTTRLPLEPWSSTHTITSGHMGLVKLYGWTRRLMWLIPACFPSGNRSAPTI